jgi:hypothetical protein
MKIGGINKFLFHSKRYRNRLSAIITECINEYEQLNPITKSGTPILILSFPDFFRLTNRHILFKTSNSPLIVDEFKKNENNDP